MKKSERKELAAPRPNEDGVKHLNVHYNVSRTPLGRMLSTYYAAHFTHHYLGPFKCVEGLVLYVKTGCRDEAYRDMHGAEAKAHFKTMTTEHGAPVFQVKDMERLLISANYAKLKHNPVIATMFLESTTEIDFYFLHGDGKIPVRPRDYADLVNALTKLRKSMQAGEEPDDLTNDEYKKFFVPAKT